MLAERAKKQRNIVSTIIVSKTYSKILEIFVVVLVSPSPPL